MDSATGGVGLILALAIAGAAGAGHCFAMCGGIAGLAGSSGVGAMWFNLGRVMSYAVIGALGATVVSLGLVLAAPAGAIFWLRGLLGLVLIILGLAMWPSQGPGGRWIERLNRGGGRVWRRIAPHSRELFPVTSIPKAVALGGLWGWMPCGLIYAAAPAAWLTADPVTAAVAMLAFGIGTLPAMGLMGFGGNALRLRLRQPGARRLAALLVMLSGLLVWWGLVGVGQGHH